MGENCTFEKRVVIIIHNSHYSGHNIHTFPLLDKTTQTSEHISYGHSEQRMEIIQFKIMP